MKIAFICINNPNDRIQRSGVPYSIYHQLEQKYDIFWIKPQIKGILKIISIILRIFFKIIHLFGKNTMQQNRLTAFIYAKSVQKQLKNKKYDAIFCLDCTIFAYLKMNKPIFYRSDAIVHLFLNYYIYNVPLFLQKEAKHIEELALKKCTNFFVPSQWVIDGIVKNNIQINLDKVILVESGANLDDKTIKCPHRKYGINQPLNMLFVGYDIMRKGFDIAYETVNILNEKYHIKANITVMGGKPDDIFLNNGRVNYAGNKNKNNTNEFYEFYQEFEKADIFIFPTKAECHGIVNCEAAAYGLPIFSYRTGGVPSYVLDEINGRILSLDKTGKDFAEAIYYALSTNKMQEYSNNSRKLYEQRFNWNNWGNTVRKYIDKNIERFAD